ncbi:hypothetical protein FBD73_15805 (plasmid) [Lacticaseibacillus paracasei]|jgi:mannose/fructose-specific phosphotransferase system component IIA|uniref:PTS sugar transporter subunit IIA n=1 Tax=Lacticaseibacillus paracasei TaxID=1597 RepID=UPI000915915D|nr:hypothetical protein [Lacticaseibacillus paracasei]ARE45402.1 hypothetical protein A3778_14925 [Lacticaseibacillus paracasei]MEA0974489.1 hypothetical protein [Lacticaseibacillus paracasei]QKK94483.1 hypothetical protein FBD73_15805 [Lacticaseibacillus paracasei]RND87042.1 EIIAB-Man [Lacticaseibacillus paracasei]RWZ59423.1 hypothetical protein EQK34_17270 [Lacticaseibacillus paracasei]
MEILITSHGGLCTGILESYEMLAGQPVGITALPLNQTDTGEYQQRLSQIMETKHEDGLLILCDIVAGTPYNESFKGFLRYPDDIRVVSGLNLAMLLEAGLALNSVSNLEDLANLAQAAAIASVVQPDTNETEGEDTEIDF